MSRTYVVSKTQLGFKLVAAAADYDVVASALTLLQTSLKECAAITEDMEHRLWDLAFLQGMWQHASACCAQLKQQHICAPGFHFPIVAAIRTVASESANEWSQQVLGKKRATMNHFNMPRDGKVAVAAAWSGPLPPTQQQPGDQTKAKHLLGSGG